MKMHNPPHPGEVISDMLEDLNLSSSKLSQALSVAPSTLQRILKKKAAVSPEMALRLEAVVGSSARMWLSMQNAYDLYLAEQELDTSSFSKLSQLTFA